MLEKRIKSLRHHIQRGCDNKLTRNFTVCGFYIIAPKNGQTAKVTYNTHIVGEIADGKLTVYSFSESHWRKDNYKYDILVNIQEEMFPEEVDKIKPEINEDNAADIPPSNKEKESPVGPKLVQKRTLPGGGKGKKGVRGASAKGGKRS